MDKFVEFLWRASQVLVVGIVFSFMALAETSTWGAILFNAFAFGIALGILWEPHT